MLNTCSFASFPFRNHVLHSVSTYHRISLEGGKPASELPCLPLPFTPSPSPSLPLPPPSTLPVCLRIITYLRADSRRDSSVGPELLIGSPCLSKSQEVVDTEQRALAMETGQSERRLWFYRLRAV